MSGDRPSRRAWPEPIRERRRAPCRMPRRLAFMVGGLTFAVAVLTVAFIVFAYWIVELKAARDDQTERLQQQITESICDLLDQLPEGGLLERPRDKYECGPGIPVAELPEELRRRYEGTPSSPSSPPMGGARPDAPRPPSFVPSPDQRGPASAPLPKETPDEMD